MGVVCACVWVCLSGRRQRNHRWPWSKRNERKGQKSGGLKVRHGGERGRGIVPHGALSGRALGKNVSRPSVPSFVPRARRQIASDHPLNRGRTTTIEGCRRR